MIGRLGEIDGAPSGGAWWISRPIAAVGLGLAFARLGYPPVLAIGLVAAVGLGSGFEVTIRRAGPGRFGLGANLGGAIVPLGVAADRVARLPNPLWGPLAAAILGVALLSLALARPVAGRGVVLAWPLVGLLAGALALGLGGAGPRSSTIAYAAGLVGPILGAELPMLPRLARPGAGRVAIGGDGLGDGLVWSAALATILAVPAR